MSKSIYLDTFLSSFVDQEVSQYMDFDKADVEITLRRLALE